MQQFLHSFEHLTSKCCSCLEDLSHSAVYSFSTTRRHLYGDDKWTDDWLSAVLCTI